MAILNPKKSIHSFVKDSWGTLLLFPAMLLLIAGNTFGGEDLSRDQVMKKAFPSAETFVRQVLRLSDELMKKLSRESGQKISSRFVTVYVAKKDDGNLGYGFIGYTKGKSSFIKYFVAITPDGKIHSIEIMSYRGEKGSEVRHEIFKKQFAGKSLGGNIKVGADINAMTGATISSQAVTNSVRNTVLIWDECFGIQKNKTDRQKDENKIH
jgi:Na+-translocating ferredoxin:NAD+ oxidoreductase RnfG subunit